MTDRAEQIRLFNQIMDKAEEGFLAMIRQNAPAGEAEDLCQEIMIHIWRSLNGFEGQSSPVTWAWSIAMNRLHAYRTKHRRREKAMRRYVKEVPSKHIGGRGQEEMLREFNQSLPAENLNIFMLYQTDTSYAEMAQLTGLKETALRGRIKRLKSKFEKWYL